MPKQKVSPIISGWHPPMARDNPALQQPGWHPPLNTQYIDLQRLAQRSAPVVPPQPVVNGTPTEEQATQIDASNTPEAVLGVDRSPALTPLQELRARYERNIQEGRNQPAIPGTNPEQKIISQFDQRASEGGKQYTNYDLDELKRLYANVLEANPVAKDYKTLLDAQKAGLLARLQAPTPVDLSGAMNLVDTMTGSRMKEGYKPPVDLTPSQFEEYQKNLQEFSKTQADEVKAQKSGEINQSLLSHLLTKEEYDRLNPNNRNNGKYDADKVDADVKLLAERVGKFVPQIYHDMSELNAVVGGLNNTKSNAPIPGFSGLDRVAPDFWLSREGSKLRQLVISVYSNAVYMASGAQINESEAERKLKEIGFNWDSKSSSLRQGIKGLKDKVAEILRGVESGFRPEVRNIYRSRGGKLSEDFEALGNYTPPAKDKPKSSGASSSAAAADKIKAARKRLEELGAKNVK